MRSAAALRLLLGALVPLAAAAGAGGLALSACNDSTPAVSSPDMAQKANPFTPNPECMGPSITPFAGSRQLVVSSLQIAGPSDGFDFLGDGKKHNKLGILSAAANTPLATSFATQHNLVIPIELFGYQGKDTACTKFAFYLGRVIEDRDADGHTTTWTVGEGDCNDWNAAAHPGATEVVGNRIDDDCDGYADNAKPGSPPADATDQDGDGVALMAGDCNDDPKDPSARSIHRGAAEICGNGLDEDCSGIADDGAGCDPFADNDAPVHVQAVSFAGATGIPDAGTTMAGSFSPLLRFPDGVASNGVITAGPDLFALDLSVQGFDIALTLTGTHTRFTVQEKNGGTYITDGTLAGVLETVSMAQIHLDIPAIGITKAQSLADTVYAGAVGSLINLTTDKGGHNQPDIDVDGDGLESFWQEQAGPAPDGGMPLSRIDSCMDGDGTIVHNGDHGVAYCPLAKDEKGNYRFVDGLSLVLKLQAVPAKLIDVVPQ